MAHQKRLFSWMNPKLEVRETEKYGKGVFAKEDLKKSETLAVFGGYILRAEDEERLPAYMNDYALQISDEFVLGITKKSEIYDTDFFNHKCDPNAGFNGQIFLVSMRRIKKGEEITFDYAMILHKMIGGKFYSFECLCGSEACRSRVTENDWKIPFLQKRYNGYFQYFLQKKIDSKKNK